MPFIQIMKLGLRMFLLWEYHRA
nr:unnamed protein product [Callosobruchus analis]